MIVLHKSKYNPKIDFLICKNLMQSIPKDCDELDFKDCFFEHKKPVLAHEMRILKIKRFFKSHNTLCLTRVDIQKLYQIITGRKEKFSSGIFCPICYPDDIVILANLVHKSEVSDKYALFRILLFVGYCKANNKTIIPYRWLCREIYDSIEQGDDTSAFFIWEHIHIRTNKYFASHDICENQKAVEQINARKNDFMINVGAKNLYLFGSLAVGRGNRYSDIDMIAVFPNGLDLRGIREICNSFWESELQIPFDIIVMSEDEFENISRPAIKRTLRKIGGDCDDSRHAK